MASLQRRIRTGRSNWCCLKLSSSRSNSVLLGKSENKTDIQEMRQFIVSSIIGHKQTINAHVIMQFEPSTFNPIDNHFTRCHAQTELFADWLEHVLCLGCSPGCFLACVFNVQQSNCHRWCPGLVLALWEARAAGLDSCT